MKKLLWMMWLGMLVLLGVAGCAALGAGRDGGGAVATQPAKVAVYMDRGARGCGHYLWLRMVTMAEGLTCVPVDAAAIRAGALDGVEMLVVPGGRSPIEAKTLGAEGRDKVREFIRNGGGYLGTCAGCYLAMNSSKSHPNMLHIAPYQDAEDTGGGSADLVLKYLPAASNVLGVVKKTQRVLYAGGPILMPDVEVPGAKFELVAAYNSDINAVSSKPRPSFAGRGAMAVGTYGKGRVFISAVHPEYDRDDHNILRAAFEHVLGRKVAWRYPQRRPGQLAVGVVCDNSLGVATAKFLQEQFAAKEFDLTPINADAISSGALRHLDAVIVPATAEFIKSKGMLGAQQARAKDFVARGGRVFVWGEGAAAYKAIGATEVKDEKAAVAALRAFAASPVPAAAKPAAKQPKFRAAMYTDKGGSCYSVMRCLGSSPECALKVVSAKDIANGVLKDFDLVLQPGGGCHTQYTALGEQGAEELKKFVRNGGKYYGICAGAFLASQITNPKRPRLGLVPYRHMDETTYLGWAKTKVAMTEEGLKVFGNSVTNRMIQYWGGPVLVPGEPVPDSDVKVLATYVGNTINTCQPLPVKPMTGKAALVGGRVGKGKVYVQCPHPEKHEDTFDMVTSAFKYLTGVELHPARIDRVRGAVSVFFKSTKDQAGAQYFADQLGQDPRIDVTFDSDLDQDLLEHVEVAVVDDEKYLKEPELQDFIARGGRVVLPKKDAAGKLDWSNVTAEILKR